MAETISTKRTFKLNGTQVAVEVELQEVHDYNAEQNFHPADDNYIPYWYGIDVAVAINDIELLGQVQYDSLNVVWSTSCDGNPFYDDIKSAVFAQFPKRDLIDRYPATEDNSAYTECSDLYYEIEDEFVPDIERFITDVAYELSGLE